MVNAERVFVTGTIGLKPPSLYRLFWNVLAFLLLSSGWILGDIVLALCIQHLESTRLLELANWSVLANWGV